MTTDNDSVFEPAVLVKAGTPLTRPHQHKNHLPREGSWVDEVDGDEDGIWVPNADLVNGSIWRCTCDDYFMYFERNVSYLYSFETVPGTSHWARCTEDGRVYKLTNLAPWWKKMWGVSDYQYVAEDLNA